MALGVINWKHDLIENLSLDIEMFVLIELSDDYTPKISKIIFIIIIHFKKIINYFN